MTNPHENDRPSWTWLAAAMVTLVACASDRDAEEVIDPAIPPSEIGGGQAGVSVPDTGAASDDGGVDADPLDPDAATPVLGCESGPYFPFAPGNTWTYLVTSFKGTGSRFMKVNRVMDLEPVPVAGPHLGKMAYRVETTGKSSSTKAISWQAIEGPRLVRYAEQQYKPSGPLELTQYWEPNRLRLDEEFAGNLTAGQSWIERFADFKVAAKALPEFVARPTDHTDYWSVEAVDELVTVPRGTFKTVRIKKLLNSTSDERGKTYWFARCVGKVKERGVALWGQHEDLVDFTVQP